MAWYIPRSVREAERAGGRAGVIIRKQAYPRVGLVGNPSDGYNGKTISFAFTNFRAEVVLYETPELEILPNVRDHSVFGSMGGLVRDVQRFGYYGGIRLLKATVKRFYEWCEGAGASPDERNFTVRYESNIPHLVGLAGSSAIITACLRALMAFFGVRIGRAEQANLVLSVEKEELGIAAGLQDRVAQAYQGLVYMDFGEERTGADGRGWYEELDMGLLPPLYVAYRADLSEGSEVVHSGLRERYMRGDAEVVEAIAYWAGLTDRVRDCLLGGRGGEIGALLDANFDRRARVCRISEGNMRMVEAARTVGASAKFTGSGGAIVGTYDGDAMFRRLGDVMGRIGVDVIRPVLAAPVGEDG